MIFIVFVNYIFLWFYYYFDLRKERGNGILRRGCYGIWEVFGDGNGGGVGRWLRRGSKLDLGLWIFIFVIVLYIFRVK